MYAHMITFPYSRLRAVLYARRWAFGRNPDYYSFDGIGGDCTNFVSQCLYAGSGVMNFTPVFGWFYKSPSDRTASWTGVEFLYNFLLSNEGAGPFAAEVIKERIRVGDVIQLGTASGEFYHSCLVSGLRRGEILVAAHSYDTFDRPLSSYSFAKARFLHIEGVRRE